MSHTIGGLDPWTRVALTEIGAVVRYLRGQHGLSQRVMGERSGLSQSTVSRLENGLLPGLRLAWLARVFVGLHRDSGPWGARNWQAPSPAGWELLIQRFAATGQLAQRMREAELKRAESIGRLMQQQASRKARWTTREREPAGKDGEDRRPAAAEGSPASSPDGTLQHRGR